MCVMSYRGRVMLHILKSKIIRIVRLSNGEPMRGRVRMFTVWTNVGLKLCGPEYVSDGVRLPFGERIIVNDEEVTE